MNLKGGNWKRAIYHLRTFFGSSPAYTPRKIKRLVKNCLHGILHVRNDVKFCSHVHADTF